MAGYHADDHADDLCHLDSSGFAAYGNQHGANYNHHYQQKGFHPLFCFDGLTGDCLRAELRAGNVYTSRQVVRFINPVLSRYEAWAPDSLIALRGDSGFAVPELFKLAETKGHKYAIRLKANASLQKTAQAIADPLLNPDRLHERQVHYKEFLYKADSWDRPPALSSRWIALQVKFSFNSPSLSRT